MKAKKFKYAIALSGGIACGKSTAASLLRLFGYCVICADEIAHEVLNECADEVLKAFGDEILDSIESSKSSIESALQNAANSANTAAKNNLDSIESKIHSEMIESKIIESAPKIKISRQKLGAIVFKNRAKRELLEQILQPKIKEKIYSLCQKQEAAQIPYFVDIPLFFEKGDYEISPSVLIYAPREVQISRLKARNALNTEEANARINAQMDIEKKKNLADFVIENTGSLKDLEKNIESFLETFLQNLPKNYEI